MKKPFDLKEVKHPSWITAVSICITVGRLSKVAFVAFKDVCGWEQDGI